MIPDIHSALMNMMGQGANALSHLTQRPPVQQAHGPMPWEGAWNNLIGQLHPHQVSAQPMQPGAPNTGGFVPHPMQPGGPQGGGFHPVPMQPAKPPMPMPGMPGPGYPQIPPFQWHPQMPQQPGTPHPGFPMAPPNNPWFSPPQQQQPTPNPWYYPQNPNAFKGYQL